MFSISVMLPLISGETTNVIAVFCKDEIVYINILKAAIENNEFWKEDKITMIHA